MDRLLFAVVFFPEAEVFLEAEVFFEECFVPEVFLLALLFFAVLFLAVFFRARFPDALLAGGDESFTPSLRASGKTDGNCLLSGSSRDPHGVSADAFLREQIRSLVLSELCLVLQPF